MAEVMLRIIAFCVPEVSYVLNKQVRFQNKSAKVIKDKQLGHRPHPEYPTHDKKGFRNRSVPKIADIVALGDSQTYGTGVFASEAWPRQLEDLSHMVVYSMAYGGYGPVHSLVLWDEATNLNPTIIIYYRGFLLR